ncbi:hypothetical protein [Chamaesiphon minutus]|uniref:Uncharacterized protein n=1 Tax=Chamaesiphon minutus (strain ATCC 27169 / PCC 6605) TaxID=1173020 RepID=K9UDZ3_CHAP6|nr:hypothetical protein [Chamaesiphon minutus]AFY93322.1 hypothetical protein Cha6605_2239 [Chamaesiphon minutus PCC 6605]
MSPTHKNRSISDIEADLINCLLAAPTIDYPWNPADPDTADYYARSDRHFCLENLSDTELYVGVASPVETRSQSFSIWEQSL